MNRDPKTPWWRSHYPHDYVSTHGYNSLYVDRERRIEYLPYELDLLNKLGLACRTLGDRFRARMADLTAAINARLPQGYLEGTSVHAMLALLVPETDLPDLPTEERLRLLGTWTAEKQATLQRIEERLSQEPRGLIRLRTEAKRALELVSEDISAVGHGLSDASIAALRQAKREADITRLAAEAAARRLFSDQPVPDLGSEPWRRMLIHAREFAGRAFPDAPPPSTG